MAVIESDPLVGDSLQMTHSAIRAALRRAEATKESRLELDYLEYLKKIS